MKSFQFTVRGHGPDEEFSLSVAAGCLFASLSSRPEDFSLRLPADMADCPVVWTFTHDATYSEDLMAFLEANLEGVRFLGHLGMYFS